ncbi:MULTISPECIES: GxxExxY protein [Emticicia]|nr:MULTISPECIES: GxxExxY protein [Emticicia]
MIYEDVKVDIAYHLDIDVENKVIIELKSVKNLLVLLHKQ